MPGLPRWRRFGAKAAAGFLGREAGQALVEYALIIALVIIVVVAAVTAFGAAIGPLIAAIIPAL
ncbi:MAG: Flp family type IVb pilin [Nitrospinota bacterium]|jgi:Flp pilus assembly pilin Flp|nr:Flp family type IVb pilin [Nitrospinota bacterium]MDP6279431.1 Flp family type IVb pilin [Nitrospinota bacterium]MDP6367229.1 Flp family type IVb pilin [Nitrospinota bacterium]MDP7167644.1 Flp family type IVb pilin [Nitrospinota bacterium]MDP7370668.1 Flp family type IVb pilin [Nitrospinota bacterium]|tara:strand:- start:204 stop:395 length:192 start_codon:yes stop_codon:yes gene_type:complete